MTYVPTEEQEEEVDLYLRFKPSKLQKLIHFLWPMEFMCKREYYLKLHRRKINGKHIE